MPRRRRRSSDDETDWTQWVVIYFGTMISLGVMMMLVDVLSFVARSFMNQAVVEMSSHSEFAIGSVATLGLGYTEPPVGVLREGTGTDEF